MKTIQCKVKAFFIEVITGYGTVVGNNGENADVPETHVADFVGRGLVHAPKGFDASPLDHDNDGKAGGSLPSEPPVLAGKNKAALLSIAAVEKVVVPDGATNAEITAAIEAKRAQASDSTGTEQQTGDAAESTSADDSGDDHNQGSDGDNADHADAATDDANSGEMAPA